MRSLRKEQILKRLLKPADVVCNKINQEFGDEHNKQERATGCTRKADWVAFYGFTGGQ
ncbi:hypothetical protein GCM10009067_40400 [Haloarcula sebkhae]|uniref:Uncharacterized protein n=1 Tax=Haloarcula sebkhae TaxID=932660 RepID=A0A830EQI1_9EURY|nr:hypothetical protein GCM10009067_40400 [Haloarcula sebkhae]